MCHRKAWNLLNIDAYVLRYNFEIEIDSLFYLSKIAFYKNLKTMIR
jgi:hypothetical protein